MITLIVVGSVSVFYAPTLSDFMPGSGNVSFAIAFIVIVLLSTLVVWKLVNMLSKLVTKLKLKSWNNQMGAFLGVINGVFISMILTFCLLVFVIPRPVKNQDGTYTSVTYDNDKSFIMNSFFGPYLTSATLTTIDHLPCGRTQFYNNIREKLQKQAQDIKEKNSELQQTYDSNSYDNYDNRQYDNRQYAPQDQYRQSGYNQQDYPDQRYPNGYQNQNYPDQRYPNQNYHNQNYQNSGYNGGSYPSQQPQRQPSSTPGYNGSDPLNGVL